MKTDDAWQNGMGEDDLTGVEIILAENSGFCSGVTRAINMAFEAAERSEGKVYTIGPLIHNPQVVRKLEEHGVGVIERLTPGMVGTVIVRSHGLHPDVIAEAERIGLDIVDATCPFVKKAQHDAASLSADGYQVIVVGSADHPEVEGIVGYAGDEAIVVDSVEEASGLGRWPRIGIVSQTTFSVERHRQIVSELIGHARELKVYNTICSETSLRQRSTVAVGLRADMMIVIGGKNSSNTTRLAELCRAHGRETHHIETAAELRPEWFRGKPKVGVTAGASTPQWIIDEVIGKIRDLFQAGAVPSSSPRGS